MNKSLNQIFAAGFTARNDVTSDSFDRAVSLSRKSKDLYPRVRGDWIKDLCHELEKSPGHFYWKDESKSPVNFLHRHA